MWCLHAATLLMSMSRSEECVKWASSTVLPLWWGSCLVYIWNIWLPTTVLLISKYVASCEGGTVWSHAHIWSDHQKHHWITAGKFTCSKHRHSFKHLQETPNGALSPVVVKRPKKRRRQWVTVLYRWHTKKQHILDQFITKADVSPSGKWHLSHFSLRWVCEWCLQPSIIRVT